MLKTLLPDYITDETIFWNPKSAGYCNKVPPDNKIGTTPVVVKEASPWTRAKMAGATSPAWLILRTLAGPCSRTALQKALRRR
ncbi:MAG: hypothetical protein WDN28_17965 [Chthoniobacter sp.]